MAHHSAAAACGWMAGCTCSWVRWQHCVVRAAVNGSSSAAMTGSSQWAGSILQSPLHCTTQHICPPGCAAWALLQLWLLGPALVGPWTLASTSLAASSSLPGCSFSHSGHRADHVQTERLDYASTPQTYLQQWLRREPPKHELPLLMRAAHADAGEHTAQPHKIATLVQTLSAKGEW